MSFNDPVSCYNYMNRMDNENYHMECVPAGEQTTNVVTQNFHNTARIINLINKVMEKVN